MKLISSLFSGSSGVLYNNAYYVNRGSHIVRSRPTRRAPLLAALAASVSWQKAISPLVGECGRLLWPYYFSALNPDSSYLFSFTKVNRAAMFPGTDKRSAIFTWGNVPPLILSQDVLIGNTQYYTVDPNYTGNADPLDIVDLWGWVGGTSNFQLIGPGYFRSDFPWSYEGYFPSPNFMLVWIVSRFSFETGVLVGLSCSLSTPFY